MVKSFWSSFGGTRRGGGRKFGFLMKFCNGEWILCHFGLIIFYHFLKFTEIESLLWLFPGPEIKKMNHTNIFFWREESNSFCFRKIRRPVFAKLNFFVFLILYHFLIRRPFWSFFESWACSRVDLGTWCNFGEFRTYRLLFTTPICNFWPIFALYTTFFLVLRQFLG